MKIPYFCCIGAELKRYEKDFDFMNQVYLYKVPADDTMEEVLAQDYFQAVADTVLQDDIIYIYEPTTEMLYTCHFNKQNGHITAEQMSNNIPSLTPDKILISDATGHITAGDVSLDYIKNQLLAKVNIDGSSVMTGPLKFRAGSFVGAIAGGLGDGISIYKLKSDDSIDSEVASLTKENGFTPGTTNAQNIGSPTLKWKDLYVARVIAAVLNNGADINIPTTGGTLGLNDFSNITDSAKNISNWSSNVSNCITNIPQDIKLELGTGDNAGKMILKAGSKAYIPNGSGVFDTVVIPNDIILTASSSYTRALFLTASGGTDYITIDRLYSGTTAPTGFTGTAYWYDTTNNVIKMSTDSGSTWSIPSDKKSLPLALFTTTSGAITSINHIFNGFGYIGSTVFALPGVKGLIPNGRNADGTLKNTAFTVGSVLTDTGSATGRVMVRLKADEIATGDLNYDETNNYNRHSNGSIRLYTVICSLNRTSGVISSFEPKSAFRAVDYSDTEYIAHQAMPSNRYVDLTLGTSGATYTAPADGWLFLNKTQGTANTRIEMYNQSSKQRTLCIGSSSTGQWLYGSMQAKRGDVIEVVYSATGSTNAFKFIYAEGAK